MPIARPSFIAATIVAGAVFVPSTTSNSFITLAGAKKCVPATASGRAVAAAIRSMSMAEVLLNSSAPGFITRSSSANTACFTPICSNTASITASHSAIASYPSTGEISASRRSISVASMLPRFTLTA